MKLPICNCDECNDDRREAALQADTSRLIDNPTMEMSYRAFDALDQIHGDEVTAFLDMVYAHVQARISHGFLPHQSNLQIACIKFANIYHDAARAEAEAIAKKPWLGGA